MTVDRQFADNDGNGRHCRRLRLLGAMMATSVMVGSVAHAALSGPKPDGTSLGAGAQPGGGNVLGRLYDPYADPAGPGNDAAGSGAPGQGEDDRSQQAANGAPDGNGMTIEARDDGASPPAGTPAPTAADPGEPPEGATESLRNAIVAALKQNPEIQIALAQQDDARYGVHEAWSGYLPHVDMTVALGSEYNSPELGSVTTLRRSEGVVTLNQNLWDFGTTINDIKRAQAAYRSAQWGTREKIEAISYDISTSYLTVLERSKLIDLAESEIAATQKILKMVEIQEDLGLTSPADVSRAKARLENLQAELLDRQSAFQQAREDYRRLTNHLPAKVADLPSAASMLPATAQDAVAMIDDHSPRLAQAVQDRRSVERQRASQTGTFYPRVSLTAQGNWKDNVQGATGLNRDARAMVTVSYSFFNGGRDLALRNRLSARLREADYELDKRRREVEQDIRIDFNALDAARGKIATIESEIAAAQKTADLYRQQFREGRRSVFDLLDSQQILHNAMARQVTNTTARLLAEFRVLQKLGGLFDLVSNGEPLPEIVTPAPGAMN